MHKRDYYLTATPVALKYVTKIAEMVSRLEVLGMLSVEPSAQDRYRREAVEATLKIDEIKDELSLISADKAYSSIENYDSYSFSSLLKTHGFLCIGLDGYSGVFRSRGVGVYVDGELVHAGERSDRVPLLVEELLVWAATTDVHPLIKSAVVHFELEYIHPFGSGNGVIGRLWQRLLLSEWKSIFEWLPLEAEIDKRREEYFGALYVSSRSADSTRFVEFMLEVIHDAVDGLNEVSVARVFNKSSVARLSEIELSFLEAIAGFIETNGSITNKNAQQLTGRSAESVKKYLARLVDLELLEARGEKKGRKYILASKGSSE